MIAEHGEYIITFTDEDIRKVLGEGLTDEQCEGVAYEVAGLFEDEFAKNVRNAEV